MGYIMAPVSACRTDHGIVKDYMIINDGAIVCLAGATVNSASAVVNSGIRVERTLSCAAARTELTCKQTKAITKVALASSNQRTY